MVDRDKNSKPRTLLWGDNIKVPCQIIINRGELQNIFELETVELKKELFKLHREFENLKKDLRNKGVFVY